MTLNLVQQIGTDFNSFDSSTNNHIFPLDIIRIIFQKLKCELPCIALVCKSWKCIVDDPVFRIMIRPLEAFGCEEWKEYLGIDAGDELPLPRCVYRHMENGNNLLTFIPEDVLLNNLDDIGKLVENPKSGHKTGYNINSWIDPFKRKWELKKPHWVCINTVIIGKRLEYLKQLKLVKEAGGTVSELIDTIISVFTAYVKSREFNFIHSLKGGIFVKESCNGYRIYVGFTSSGLILRPHYFGNVFFHYPGVACSYKFFGICT